MVDKPRRKTRYRGERCTSKLTLNAFRSDGLAGQLRTVPDTHDPDRVLPDSVEEPIRSDDDFPIRQIREFRNVPTRFRKSLEAPQRLQDARVKPPGGARSISQDIGDNSQELAIARWGESDPHAPASRSS